jgi:hypothetical protein
MNKIHIESINQELKIRNCLFVIYYYFCAII